MRHSSKGKPACSPTASIMLKAPSSSSSKRTQPVPNGARRGLDCSVVDEPWAVLAAAAVVLLVAASVEAPPSAVLLTAASAVVAPPPVVGVLAVVVSDRKSVV